LSVILGLLAVSSAVGMQQSAKVYKIGLLTSGSGSIEPVRQNLRSLGYIEGRNVVIELRDTEGRIGRADELAVELAKLKVDVIVAMNPAAVIGAKRATATIPIVMVHTPDPVELGLVASLARPGGNITGLTTLSTDLSIKQLELLKEMVPQASRVALLWNPDNPWHPRVVQSLRQEQRLPGIQLQVIAIRGPNDFDSAFQALSKERSRAILVLADPMTFVHRRQLVDTALTHRLPLMGAPRAYTEAGGLMSYWADEIELYKRVAGYVDRILKGANPGDLPIEQPSKYELVVNSKTAKALALTIPPALLLRATLIE
jgi:putative ABC transport system substrate-binding protein